MTIPVIHDIEHIQFPPPEEQKLNNGIPAYIFSGAQNDILRIDLVFDAGRWMEKAQQVANATSALIKSGTKGLTSFQLSEKIDFYGTTIKGASGYNTFTLSLYCMNRFLEPSLEWFMVCLQEIIFPEHEVDILKKNSIARLRVNKEKIDYLADNEFRKIIFGAAHPYGYETTEAALENLSSSIIAEYYQTQLRTDNAALFIAGKVDAHVIALVEKYIGQWNPQKTKIAIPDFPVVPGTEKKVHIPKEKSVQASIAIGKTLFNKWHPDYGQFILLNTIFGGYFGSRLMGNIREEKGLTYGIHSGLNALKFSGYWAIYTDTNNSTLELCLREIYSELERLYHETITKEELKLARNYILGKYLSRTDGPFNRMETFKSFFIEGVPMSSFQQYVEDIKAADALSLQRLAREHLSMESMYEVVAG